MRMKAVKTHRHLQQLLGRPQTVQKKEANGWHCLHALVLAAFFSTPSELLWCGRCYTKCLTSFPPFNLHKATVKKVQLFVFFRWENWIVLLYMCMYSQIYTHTHHQSGHHYVLHLFLSLSDLPVFYTPDTSTMY